MPGSKFQPALYGGLLLGVLSGLPFIGFGNCCCCLWVIAGGAAAAYLLQANQPVPITPGDGATVGLMAGVIGFVVWQVLSLVTMPLTRGVQGRMFSYILRNAQDLPPDVAQAIERANTGGVSLVGLVMTAFLVLIVSMVFSTIGGLIGAALFKKKDVVVLPPDMPPPPPPPPGY
jgi:hypothetical protein